MPTAAAAKKADTDTSSESKNRFVVSLPSDVGEMIDRVGARLSAALQAETGIGFELSRAQIVQALVRQALKDQDSPNGNEATADEPTAVE